MRSNWKKRLGVCGALTLLCLTVVSGALASPADAQVATGGLNITGSFVGTGLPRSDFSFELNGVAQAFPASGTAMLTGLPVDVTYTVTPVPKDGFTAEVNDTFSTCTNVTLDPAPAAPKFCLVTFTFIPPTTTTESTTTTTTTTTPPTTAAPGQETIHGSFTDSNRCRSHLEPNLNPDADLRIGATLSTDAYPQPHRGDPIALTNTKLGLNIPASLIQQGIDLELISAGTQVPSVVTVGVKATNTTQQTHTYVISATATILTQAVPVSPLYPKGLKALPLNVQLGLPNTNWTPTSDTADVFFSQRSLKIVARLSLPGIGLVVVTFTCSPATTTEFVALGAQGAPVDPPGGGGTPPPPPPGFGPGDGVVDPGALPGGAELPRTGSATLPLLVVAGVLTASGLLAIAGSKRRRRPLAG